MSPMTVSERFILRLPSAPLTLLLLAGLGFALTSWGLSNVGQRTQEAAAVQNAMMLARSIQGFRSVYTREVVAKLENHGIIPTPGDHLSHREIALPYTLSRDLADEIGSEALGSQTKIYSPYSFSWRDQPGLPDDFARLAWSRLSADPTTPVQQIEQREGGPSLRYAVPDLMTEGCVGCHNTYPGSPRTNWKVGDLRGVIEVILPLERQAAVTGTWLSRGIYFFSALAGLWCAVAGLSIFSSRKSKNLAVLEARRHREISQELQAAIVEREVAEKETRHLENQIQEAQKLESFSVMVGGLAHDFNNLLVPVIANSIMMRDQAHDDSENRELLEEIELAANKAADLCNQMLVYAGKVSAVDRIPLDLSVLMEETGRLLAANIGARCELDLDLAKDLPLFEADGVQMSQVLLNLISNASDALGDAGGTIRLRTGRTDVPVCKDPCGLCAPGSEGQTWQSTTGRCQQGSVPSVFFEVYDDGIGMDEETVGKIFDPFFTTKFTGRGLGLAAAQGIIRSHGGSIHVDSAAGSHTSIRVVFPAADPIEVRENLISNDNSDFWRGSGTILLAEDDPLVRAVAERMLEDLGFTVTAEADGEAALWRFSREPDRFVALVSDLTMPKMDGLEALHAIRKIRPDLPALLCSGYSERVDEIEDLDSERTIFLNKPFRSLTLKRSLQDLLTDATSEQTRLGARIDEDARRQILRNRLDRFGGSVPPAL